MAPRSHGSAIAGVSPSRFPDIARNFFCFFLAVALGETLVTAVPRPRISDPKLDYYFDHAGSFDVAFFGSSLTECGINPAAFDDVAGTKSINLGFSGAVWPEITWDIDQVLSRNPPPIIVVEAFDPEFRLVEASWFSTGRSIRWHTAELTWHGILSGWRSAEGFVKLKIAAMHLTRFLMQEGVIGRFASTEMEVTFQEASMGYIRPAPDWDVMLRNHIHFLGHPGEYRRELNIVKWRFEHPKFSKTSVRTILAQARRIRSHGVEPLYWIPASTFEYQAYYEAARRGAIRLIGRFDNPEATPRYYDPELRWDLTHLNGEGVDQLSRELAMEYLRVREESMAPSGPESALQTPEPGSDGAADAASSAAGA